MSIGMFSRASLVSVKALRSYHEQGLLVPASVDAATGYRYYRVSQLTDATIIKRLRDLDLPLRDIAEVVAARDPQITHKVIAQHEYDMKRRLAEVGRIVDELQLALDRPSLHTPVHVRHENPVHALSFAGIVNEANYADFLDDAYPALFAAVAATGARALGPGSALYPGTVELDDEPVEAYVPIAEPVTVTGEVLATGVGLTLIPAATCAVATHAGGYDKIGDTYRQLGAWVARHATSGDGPVREHYVVSTDPRTFDLVPADRLRTEICWPIESLDESHPSDKTSETGTDS